MTGPDVPDVPCNEFVEMVTDYLEGTLGEETVRNIDAHLEICPGCRRVLDQWRTVIDLTGRLAETDVDRVPTGTRAQLMAAFRHHRPG
jgi:predicted anti-sigma-YlaC factor YlaD